MPDAEPLQMTAAELGRLLRQRKVSSVELTRRCLAALEGRGRALNAVAELTEALALREAARADEEIRAGRIRSPLHGVPYGAKDLLATKGIPTRWGSPAHREQVFDHDAVVIERLRAAGAVLVAKLAMIELAGGGGYEFASASLHGPCRNPWNPDRWAGGSSSGSGAAVGAGLVPFAIGTETWGSITVPAAFCSVTGVRPTYGRVPRTGAMALSWTMDKIGPMARSAEDCGLVLQAIAGHDAGDPGSAPGRWEFRPRALAGRRFRLGLLPIDYQKNKAPEAEQAFTEALGVFRKLGHTAQDAKLPEFPYNEAAGTIIEVEGSAAFENLIRSQRLEELRDAAQQAGLLAGLVRPGVDYLRAMRIRTLAAPAAVRVFEEVDVLAAPTLLKGAIPIDRSLNDGWEGMGGNGGPGNLLGWPSISLPMGFTKDRLPLGLELIGPPHGESTLLALAIAFQRETDWHRQMPPGQPGL
jgi:aspartyl-tRNA(Asn)/glutamyl-tRNA(Gln) amidotransferase subunit A